MPNLLTGLYGALERLRVVYRTLFVLDVPAGVAVGELAGDVVALRVDRPQALQSEPEQVVGDKLTASVINVYLAPQAYQWLDIFGSRVRTRVSSVGGDLGAADYLLPAHASHLRRPAQLLRRPALRLLPGVDVAVRERRRLPSPLKVLLLRAAGMPELVVDDTADVGGQCLVAEMAVMNKFLGERISQGVKFGRRVFRGAFYGARY